MKFRFLNAALASSMFYVGCFANVAHAGLISLDGNFVSIQVSDNGTLGNGTSGPQLKYDSTGTGTFATGIYNDWMLPGSPWEGFSISTAETGLLSNLNGSSFEISGVTTDTSGISIYDSSATFTADYGSFFSITTNTFFNDNSSYVGFNTTLTALVDLSDVFFSRQFDPDWHTSTCTNFDTTNTRHSGDLVTATEGCENKVIGIQTDSKLVHNVGLGNWETDPSYWLGGPQSGAFGDNAIGIGFDLGSLKTGEKIDIKYNYVMGLSVDTLDIPRTDVPEPSTLAIFALGMIGLASRRFKKQS
ncbi:MULTISPECIES: PEP-CTERM sorting domain-containing protein [unclassified Colwellia]|jgi:hypothetical protein|uniref:PEP-CTERM sorting domain-containing protein n=1 Tax=unclassified Colwellia TaxID=196834 RepID=UPI002174F1DC|nr:MULTISPECIES: PEP-CTERM sorting domain-containing protein [unclassified Colwellia]